MTYRYCRGCDQWLETHETTLDEIGEVICPEHGEVHGSIPPGPRGSYDEDDLWHDIHRYDDASRMLRQARMQRLV